MLPLVILYIERTYEFKNKYNSFKISNKGNLKPIYMELECFYFFFSTLSSFEVIFYNFSE